MIQTYLSVLIFLLCAISFKGYTLPSAFSKKIGEVLSATGTLRIQGENSRFGAQRILNQGALVETLDRGFMHLFLDPGIQLKSREMTTLELGTINDLKTIQVKLLRGTVFLRSDGMGASTNWATEIMTPVGTITIRKGDGLVILDHTDGRLQIFCTAGSLHFAYNSLEYVLSPGETISVRDEKVASKDLVSGPQNRFLYSWYQQGQPWVIPSYFESIKDLFKSEPPTLTDFKLNGLELNEWESYQSFSPADLILGQIRIEGKIKDYLPHQVLQISLNAGKDFFDLIYNEGFVLKLDPEDRIYELVFRLRDLKKFYPVIHDELTFFFQSRGNREMVLKWADELIKGFNQKNAFEISQLLKGSESFPISIQEDLEQEFATRNFQKLDMSLYRYRENRNFITADFRWLSLNGDTFRREPVKQEGRFQVVFKRQKSPGLFPQSVSGDLPLLNNLLKQRLDREGPGVVGPLSIPFPSGAPTTISFRITDQLSNVRGVEYFVDRVGRNGSGRALNALDGQFDERSEIAQLILNPFFTAQRLYIHALDSQGNWGPFFSVTIGF